MMIGRVFAIVVVGVLVAGVAAALISTATFERRVQAQAMHIAVRDDRISYLEKRVDALEKRVGVLEEQMTIRLEPVPPSVPAPQPQEGVPVTPSTPELSEPALRQVIEIPPAIVDPPLPRERPRPPVNVRG